MFDKNSIGKRVIASDGDIGTITKVDASLTRPIEVNFDNGIGNFWYTKFGECTAGHPDDVTIKLLYGKIGSPDARKIVAMLAREYRNSLNWYEGRQTLYSIYKQAKQLLGDINEN